MTIKGLDFGVERSEIDLPAVLHMFWEAPDGRRACALANIADQAQTVELPVSDYHTEGRDIFAERNGSDQLEKLVLNTDGTVVLKLAPRDAVMVML